ncbi:MAG: hemerythrin domain-containing protein, partial [Thermoanaerobaculia bacterium]
VRAGSISRPLLNEFVEHDFAHERLAKIRELALRLRNVEGSDVQLLDELDELFRAVHRHIHLENNVLIPLVIDLENRLKASRQGDLAV